MFCRYFIHQDKKRYYSRPVCGAAWSERCSVFREFAIACVKEKALTVLTPSASAAKSNTSARGREQSPKNGFHSRRWAIIKFAYPFKSAKEHFAAQAMVRSKSKKIRFARCRVFDT